MENMNENINIEEAFSTVFEDEVIELKSVFSSLQQNDEFRFVKPKKNIKKPVIISICAALLSIAVVSAVCFAMVFFSPKAKFFRTFEDIFERHFGENEFYSDIYSTYGSFTDFNDGLELSATITENGKEQALKFDYNGTAANAFIKDNDISAQLYVDKDTAVLSDTKDNSYALSLPSLEANISAQENELLKSIKKYFEYSGEDRKELTDELWSIINKNLGSDYFESCKTNHDGKEYDAIRFYTDESETAALFASVLEDINNSENELLRLETASFLVNYFSVEMGVDTSATINNAIDGILDNLCRVEAILGFDSSSPALFALEIEFGENSFKAEYTFIRNGNTADVYFGLLLKSAVKQMSLEYEGERSFATAMDTEVAKVEFTSASETETLKMTGEANIAYVNDELNSISLALSSEDLNDRFGIVVTLGDNFSASYTNMSRGYGTGVVLTATISEEDEKITVTNGKISINEIASDDLLEYYQMDASELGAQNFAFDGVVEYSNDTANINMNVYLPDNVSYNAKIDVKGESGFFKSFFNETVLESENLTATIKVTETTSGAANITDAIIVISHTKPEIEKIEGKVALNSVDYTLDKQKADLMTSQFLSLRNNSEMVESLWQYVVNWVFELTGTELTDTNRVEFDKSIYDEIVLGQTTLGDVRRFFNAEPVYSDGVYIYFSADYDAENSKGMVISFQVDDSNIVTAKDCSDYSAAAVGSEEIEKINLKTVKEGMSKEDLLKLFDGIPPVVRYDIINEGEYYEYYYFGVKDGNAVFAVEIVDGKVKRFQ